MDTFKQFFINLLHSLWQKLLEWKDFILENLEWFVLKVLDYLIHICNIVTNVFMSIMPSFDFPDSFDAAAQVVFEYVPLINKVFPVPEFFALCAAYLSLYFFTALPFRWLCRIFPFFGSRKS
jgi:hypothetical protein